MARTDRTQTDPLALFETLRDSPFRYDFFNALRMIEAQNPDLPRIGTSRRLNEDPVRLGQDASLGFAPAALSSFQPKPKGNQWRLGVRFMGVFGPNGPLPLHLTEYARNRLFHERDQSLCAFLDIFHHRLLSVFYRAWAEAQPTVQLERPEEDTFKTYVGSTFGMGLPSSRNRDEMPDLAKLYYSGRLSCQTKHAEGLQAIIQDFFKLPTQIEEFVGQWIDLPQDCRCTVGVSPDTATMGHNMTIGSQVWDCQHHFRIAIGPLSLIDYERLLPGGVSLQRLTDIVKNYVGEELTWELNLILKKEETPATQLGMAGQLARTAWVDNQGIDRDPDDMRAYSAELVEAGQLG